MAQETRNYKYGTAPNILLLIGIVSMGIQIFGYMEAMLLNTYIDHILGLEPIYIGVMVAGSATMGLLFHFIFGVYSDNTRSKFGRRGPYLLAGGIISGVSMIAFGFSNSYIWCFIIDVVFIGIASNSYYAAQRVLVPDLVEMEHRGRVNSLMSFITMIGLLLPAVLTLFLPFKEPDPKKAGSQILDLLGHRILLTAGGIAAIVCGIIGFLFLKDSIPVENLPEKKSFREELRNTFNITELKKQGEFFKLVLAMTIYMAGVQAIQSYLFNIIFDIGLSDLDLIIVIAIAVPIFIVSLVIVGRLTDKIGRKRIIPPTILIACAGFLLTPFIIEGDTINPFLLGINFALIILGIIGVLIPINTWSQDLLPRNKKGQFQGIYNMVNTLSQVIGGLSAGVVATWLGTSFSKEFTPIFFLVPVFFLISIPLFMKVKETLVIKELDVDSRDVEENSRPIDTDIENE
ncbi:MAG: MFS transporter [Candidatus Hodarchaeota archaeon]